MEKSKHSSRDQSDNSGTKTVRFMVVIGILEYWNFTFHVPGSLCFKMRLCTIILP